MLKDLQIKVIVENVEQKQSSKGSNYYLVSYYVDLGQKFPTLVTDFSFDAVPLGEQNLNISFISDRNKNLAIQKTFSPLLAK